MYLSLSLLLPFILFLPIKCVSYCLIIFNNCSILEAEHLRKTEILFSPLNQDDSVVPRVVLKFSRINLLEEKVVSGFRAKPKSKHHNTPLCPLLFVSTLTKSSRKKGLLFDTKMA